MCISLKVWALVNAVDRLQQYVWKGGNGCMQTENNIFHSAWPQLALERSNLYLEYFLQLPIGSTCFDGEEVAESKHNPFPNGKNKSSGSNEKYKAVAGSSKIRR